VWDARAAALGLVWEEPVLAAAPPTTARCLTCGHVWKTRPNTVQRGSGCPVCAKSGFDPRRPSLVYLLLLPDPPIMKVGITNKSDKSNGTDTTYRLQQHRRHGWEIVRLWPTSDGLAALAIEDAVLRWWRDRGATTCLRDEVPAGDGFTECVHAGVVDIPRTMARVEELRAALAT